jgi:hypothetical protein
VRKASKIADVAVEVEKVADTAVDIGRWADEAADVTSRSSLRRAALLKLNPYRAARKAKEAMKVGIKTHQAPRIRHP